MAYYKSSNIKIDNNKIKYDENGQLTTNFIPVVINDELATTTTTYSSDKIENIINEATELPVASTTVLGAIKVDGTTVEVDENGVLSVTGEGGLTNVEFNNLKDGQVLTYSSLINKWTNGNGGGGSGDGYNEIYAKLSMNLGRKKNSGTGYHSAVIGYNETCQARNSLVVGVNNEILYSSDYGIDKDSNTGGSIVSGWNNILDLETDVYPHSIIAGWNCEIHANADNPNVILGGFNNIINTKNDDQLPGDIHGCVILGGANNKILAYNQNTVEYTIISGISNIVESKLEDEDGTILLGGISGDHAVFGYNNHLFAGLYDLVSGHDNILGEDDYCNNNFVIGHYNHLCSGNDNIVCGSNNIIFNTHESFINGRENHVSANQSLIIGYDCHYPTDGITFNQGILAGSSHTFIPDEYGFAGFSYCYLFGNYHTIDASSSQFVVEGYKHEILSHTVLSHVEGQNNKAINLYAGHIEGYKNIAHGDASHAEGYMTTSVGGYGSHSEGQESLAQGQYSHATGYKSQAIGNASYSGGKETISEGIASHSEGTSTQAKTDNSVSFGKDTIANNATEQFVIGRSNIEGDQAFIIGNGSPDSWNPENEKSIGVVQSISITEYTEPTFEVGDPYYSPKDYIELYDSNNQLHSYGDGQSYRSNDLSFITLKSNSTLTNLEIVQNSLLCVKSTDDLSSLRDEYKSLIEGKSLTPSAGYIRYIVFFQILNKDDNTYLYDCVSYVLKESQRGYNSQTEQFEDYTLDHISVYLYLNYYHFGYCDVEGTCRNPNTNIITTANLGQLVYTSPSVNISCNLYVIPEDVNDNILRINDNVYNYLKVTTYESPSTTYPIKTNEMKLTSSYIEDYETYYNYSRLPIEQGTVVVLVEMTNTVAPIVDRYFFSPYDFWFFAGIYSKSNAHTVDWNGNAWFAGEVEDGFGNTLSDIGSILHARVTEEQIDSLFDFNDEPLISV